MLEEEGEKRKALYGQVLVGVQGYFPRSFRPHLVRFLWCWDPCKDVSVEAFFTVSIALRQLWLR